MVGPIYPGASGSSRIASRYGASMSGDIATSSSINRTYRPRLQPHVPGQWRPQVVPVHYHPDRTSVMDELSGPEIRIVRDHAIPHGHAGWNVHAESLHQLLGVQPYAGDHDIDGYPASSLAKGCSAPSTQANGGRSRRAPVPGQDGCQNRSPRPEVLLPGGSYPSVVARRQADGLAAAHLKLPVRPDERRQAPRGSRRCGQTRPGGS